MKTFVALLLSIVFTAQAHALTIAWDANTDSAIGYVLYFQQQGASEIYSEVIDGRETTRHTIDNGKLVPGQTYDIWMTAFNKLRESGKSEILNWKAPEFIPVPNPAPVIIQIPGTPAHVTINIGE